MRLAGLGWTGLYERLAILFYFGGVKGVYGCGWVGGAVVVFSRTQGKKKKGEGVERRRFKPSGAGMSGGVVTVGGRNRLIVIEMYVLTMIGELQGR